MRPAQLDKTPAKTLNPLTNTRSDEYGGALECRVRLVRELIKETREIVEGKAAVATRFSVGCRCAARKNRP